MLFIILTVVAVAAVAGALAMRRDILKASLASAGPPATRFPRIEPLIELALYASFVLLALTAPFLAGGVTGVFLLLHVFGGAVFAVMLTAVVLLRAEANSRACCCGEGANLGTFIERLSFWMLAAAGLCLVLTSVVAMTPLFGTGGQIVLATTHKYVSILAIVSGMSCGYVAVVRRRLAQAAG